ncbi:hypothetical protein QBZ16_004550 [Prototheca wickerhamii]|uniref:Uncharacterized protein n=1 Tax=Prototheca wickerhamii TaxID=3111 RepID=A0AAD9IFY8_PROWI|nr:hypothetical protein QBZ16_004550 [Prototheca wickerhamii]
MEKLAIDWMARLLDCPLDPKLSLSSLTKNCYLLGRIAERCEPLGTEAAAGVSTSITASAAAATRPRPHREVLRDYVRFQNACHVLRVSSSDLVSLADIQEERAAQRLASCFWTLAQSAQGAGHQGIPPFMTDQERKQLRSHVRRLERSRKSKFESETRSPLKRPGTPSDSAWSLEARRPSTARGEASYAPRDDRHVCQPSPSLEFWRLREQEGSLWAPARVRRGGRRRRGVSASPALRRPGKRDVGETSAPPDSPSHPPAHAGRESWAWLAAR